MVIILSVCQMLLVGLGLVYFATIMASGLSFMRSARKAPRPEGGSDPQDVYFLVAALNESAVIAETVRSLLVDARARVILVDDASDDGTAEIALRTAGETCDAQRLQVVTRALPYARLGKGPALNAGFALVEAEVRRRGLEPDKVVVCVMDADGHLSRGALDEVLPLFNDKEVGGVQLAVRIRNRSNLLTQIQDLEFWALSAVGQFGRVKSGTVSLGGNGQFTRLSALQKLGHEPWSSALTEDLELFLELAVAGWQVTTTAKAYVDQQALTSVRRLLDQRTRWFQGHMAAIRYLPRVWGSDRLTHLGSMEILLYLLVPWALVLPWSIVFHLSLFAMLSGFASHGAQAYLGRGSAGQQLELAVLWYLISCAPNLAAIWIYKRRTADVGWFKAILLGHLLIPMSYIAFIASWRALNRMVRGRTSWVKTQRVTELPSQGAPEPQSAEEFV